MVNNAETTAKNAEKDNHNDPGMCLQVCRTWAGINSMYPDAVTAWNHTNDKHPGDRKPPRGSAVYWKGGSQGYGHIAISLGNGKVRSTDACGSGCVGTRDLGWFESNWGLPYAGWAWDINEVTIPHGDSGGDDEDMPLTEKEIEKIAQAVWQFQLAVYDTEDPDDTKMAKVIVSQTHSRAGKAAGYKQDG
jgi:hypothetical protein